MRRAIGILAGALLTAAISGCGATSQASSPPATSTSPTTSTSSSTPSGAPIVQTGTANVSGKSITVLQNSQGHTLYYFTKDTPTHSACEASQTCASLWPALKTSQVPSVSGASGKFSVYKGQLEYQGHLLYTYSGDTASSQAKGQGLYKEWWVATPSLKAAGGSTGGSGSGW